MSAPGQPLDGVAVHPLTGDVPEAVAVRILESLGATDAAGTVREPETDDVVTLISGDTDASRAAGPAARLTGPPHTDVPGLPAGTLAYASGVALAAGALLAMLAESDITVDSREIAAQVLLPAVMAGSYGTTHREPPAPRPIGNGYVACDLATPDDEATFERMLKSLGPLASDPRAVADEAQLWRLPVCAFEPRTASTATVETQPAAAAPPPDDRRPVHAGGPRRSPPLDGIVVCDLTAMWAGPLATWLLAALGADVHKIEPSIRFDGLRSPAGGGIHPPGVDPSNGDASGLFNALNRGKHRRDLDLRVAAERSELDALIAHSDLVVDSYSRRVMPNLGLGPDDLRVFNPGVASLSVPAFPAEHRWQVALGSGVHAAAGLGDVGGGRVATPVVAYPDPLTGLMAFAESLALIIASRRGQPTAHREVSLLGSTLPLASLAAPSPVLTERDPDLARGLLDDPELAAQGAWPELDDGAGRHRYPRCPFLGPWQPPTLAPAPPLAPEGAAR